MTLNFPAFRGQTKKADFSFKLIITCHWPGPFPCCLPFVSVCSPASLRPLLDRLCLCLQSPLTLSDRFSATVVYGLASSIFCICINAFNLCAPGRPWRLSALRQYSRQPCLLTSNSIYPDSLPAPTINPLLTASNLQCFCAAFGLALYHDIPRWPKVVSKNDLTHLAVHHDVKAYPVEFEQCSDALAGVVSEVLGVSVRGVSQHKDVKVM